MTVMDMGESQRWKKVLKVAAAAGLAALLAIAGVCAYVELNRYGSEPSYFVDSYDALKADLSPECPAIRFPDLSRYEGLPGFRCQVSYDGGRLSMHNKRYLISWSADHGEHAERSSVAWGAGTPLSGLSVQTYNLQSFGGRSGEAPAVNPNASLGGVDVELGSAEHGPSGGAAPYGSFWVAFALDGFFYRVSGTYVAPADGGAPDGDAVRQAARSEIIRIAESIIEQ